MPTLPEPCAYLQSRLIVLLEEVRALRSDYALAAVCEACEQAVADNAVNATSRLRNRAVNRFTANDLVEESRCLITAFVLPEEIDP